MPVRCQNDLPGSCVGAGHCCPPAAAVGRQHIKDMRNLFSRCVYNDSRPETLRGTGANAVGPVSPERTHMVDDMDYSGIVTPEEMRDSAEE